MTRRTMRLVWSRSGILLLLLLTAAAAAVADKVLSAPSRVRSQHQLRRRRRRRRALKNGPGPGPWLPETTFTAAPTPAPATGKESGAVTPAPPAQEPARQDTPTSSVPAVPPPNNDPVATTTQQPPSAPTQTPVYSSVACQAVQDGNTMTTDYHVDVLLEYEVVVDNGVSAMQVAREVADQVQSALLSHYVMNNCSNAGGGDGGGDHRRDRSLGQSDQQDQQSPPQPQNAATATGAGATNSASAWPSIAGVAIQDTRPATNATCHTLTVATNKDGGSSKGDNTTMQETTTAACHVMELTTRVYLMQAPTDASQPDQLADDMMQQLTQSSQQPWAVDAIRQVAFVSATASDSDQPDTSNGAEAASTANSRGLSGGGWSGLVLGVAALIVIVGLLALPRHLRRNDHQTEDMHPATMSAKSASRKQPDTESTSVVSPPAPRRCTSMRPHTMERVDTPAPPRSGKAALGAAGLLGMASRIRSNLARDRQHVQRQRRSFYEDHSDVWDNTEEDDDDDDERPHDEEDDELPMVMRASPCQSPPPPPPPLPPLRAHLPPAASGPREPRAQYGAHVVVVAPQHARGNHNDTAETDSTCEEMGAEMILRDLRAEGIVQDGDAFFLDHYGNEMSFQSAISATSSTGSPRHSGRHHQRRPRRERKYRDTVEL